MKRSFIREILENITEDTISFAGGLPNEDLFPLAQIKESSNRVLLDKNSLQYTTSIGYAPLREKIANFYTAKGFPTSSKNILITSGAQQALDIISRYYQHQEITIESPSYLGAVNVFGLNNMILDPIKLSSEGINLNFFEKSFTKTNLTYLIPDFQNPTSSTYSLKHREAIAKIILKNKGLIIEDSPYSSLYFKDSYPEISQYVPNNSFNLGSFSKILSPSLRIGWIRASEELLSPLIPYKEAMDLHSCALSQYILNDFLKDKNNFHAHLNKLRNSYTQNMIEFSKALKIYLPEFIFKEPQGGMFIYGTLPNIDTAKLIRDCIKKGVVFVPGIEFYTNSKVSNEIRFNFTHCDKRTIHAGLKIIRSTINENEKNYKLQKG